MPSPVSQPTGGHRGKNVFPTPSLCSQTRVQYLTDTGPRGQAAIMRSVVPGTCHSASPWNLVAGYALCRLRGQMPPS
jgi:hypothetical protein